MSNQTRVRPGIPTGGQFAATQHAESDVELDAEAPVDTRDWGSVTVATGARTPWGEADHVSYPADGIARVGTDGHGGIKLSPERNARIPAPLRNRSGWYEEDCEASIVGMYHPEAFPHLHGGDEVAIIGVCEQSVKDWFPNQWEAAKGRALLPEESAGRREQMAHADAAAFRAAHSDRFVTHQSGDTHADWIPDGYAVMPARIDDTGEVRHFLMPKDEAISDHVYRKNVLVDPNRHLDVSAIVATKPEDPWPYGSTGEGLPKLHGEQVTPSYEGMTSVQRARAAKELNTRYRFRENDGSETIETLGEHFARVGVTSKYTSHDGSKNNFVVQYGQDSRVQPVSKAAYDALSGLPDVTTEGQKLHSANAAARARLERTSMWDREKFAKAKADVESTGAAYKAHDEVERAAASDWQRRRNQMQQQAMADLLAERNIEMG